MPPGLVGRHDPHAGQVDRAKHRVPVDVLPHPVGRRVEPDHSDSDFGRAEHGHDRRDRQQCASRPTRSRRHRAILAQTGRHRDKNG